jgi:hypothetical protein
MLTCQVLTLSYSAIFTIKLKIFACSLLAKRKRASQIGTPYTSQHLRYRKTNTKGIVT